MANAEENAKTPVLPKPNQSPKDEVSQTSSSHPNNGTSSLKKTLSQKEFILSAAAKIASQTLHFSDPDVWAVLTAISDNARKRHQGLNMLLTADEHCIGRLVDDARFRIESTAVSAYHCKIFRKSVTTEDLEHQSNLCSSVSLKDTSTNGTYLNWEKLKRNTPEAKLQHGDIISFAAPPQHELAYAFVYREVCKSAPVTAGTVLKRKAEEFDLENKRLKGIGIGAPDGPISLDDFRILQRSNTELRKQLENHVLAIDTLRNENRVGVERHEHELKELKESVSQSYHDQLKELQHFLEVKQKELEEVNRVLAEQKQGMENLSERLNASNQSCSEANEIIISQKTSITELKAQLDEERDQRREEREKAASDLKAAIQKAQSEAKDEIRQISDAALRREREQEEVISKLQESEKERCLLVESLRCKLEETRHKLVISDEKIRQHEAQVCEEQMASASRRKRVEEIEHEMRRFGKELESEKAAREEAWAKVSTLELEITAAMRDLDFEKRKLKAARERIMLRETQLRAFYSTTEEISILFAKQQEQLKAMQRTLEDEENYEDASLDIDLNDDPNKNNNVNNIIVETSSDEASVTEKHNCDDLRTQEQGQNTQETDSPNTHQFVNGAFGSDVDGTGAVEELAGDPIGTERVLETESQIDLNKSSTLAGDTMQLDDEAHVQESVERARNITRGTQLSSPVEMIKSTQDTEGGGTIKTADLLASEVVGSWACSTAPSVHGENESPKSRDIDDEGAKESQSIPSLKFNTMRLNQDSQALCEMIGIVAPELKDQFVRSASDLEKGKECPAAISDSDTEDCSEEEDDHNNGVDAVNGSILDSETEGSDRDNRRKNDDVMDEDDDNTQEDSLG